MTLDSISPRINKKRNESLKLFSLNNYFLKSWEDAKFIQLDLFEIYIFYLY